MGIYVSFFVKVEGQAHSSYRNPEGVYQIDVIKEGIPIHSLAPAVISSALTNIPFIQDDQTKFSLRLFSDKGDEIIVSGSSLSDTESKTCFCGRSSTYPTSIDM